MREMVKIFPAAVVVFFFFNTSFAGTFWRHTNGPHATLPNFKSIVTFSFAGSNMYAGCLNGVFSSRDGGATWLPIKTGNGNVWAQAVAASQSRVVYAGTRDSGIFRTTDFGDTWDNVHDGTADAQISALLAIGQNTVLAGTGRGILRSDNQGDTWIRSDSGFEHQIVVTLMLANSGRIYAGSTAGIVVYSTDQGHNWTPLLFSDTGAIMGIVEIAPQTMCLGTTGQVALSTDGGQNWERKHTGVNALVARHNGTLLIGDASGMWTSEDGGRTWTQSRGLLAAVTELGIGPNDEILAQSSIGPCRSTNGGASWMPANYNAGAAASVERVYADDAGRLFAATLQTMFTLPPGSVSWDTSAYISRAFLFLGDTILSGAQGMYRSFNHGRNWTAINSGFTNSHGSTPSVRALAWRAPWVFVATDSGIFRSRDLGYQWSRCDSTSNSALMTVAIATDGSVFAGGGDIIPVVFRSTDNGISWTNITGSLPPRPITTLAAHPNGTIFAGSDTRGVFRWTPGTGAWAPVNSGLNSFGQYVHSIVINNEGGMFAGTNIGVFHSTNNGDTWGKINTGMGDLYVYSLAFDPWARIYAGTDSGVFASIDRTTGVDEYANAIPTTKTFHISLTPNPAQTNLSITIDAAEIENAEVSIVDALGRVHENRRLHNDRRTSIDLSRYPAGVYLCRVSMRTGGSCRSFLVIH